MRWPHTYAVLPCCLQGDARSLLRGTRSAQPWSPGPSATSAAAYNRWPHRRSSTACLPGSGMHLADTGCANSLARSALHELVCALCRRPDPRWQAVLKQIDMDVSRTPCGGASFCKADLTNILALCAYHHDRAYTQVLRKPATCRPAGSACLHLSISLFRLDCKLYKP